MCTVQSIKDAIRENCQSQAFREAASRLLFDHMDLQVIKIDLLDEAVPCEPGLIVELKVFYIGIQPDGLAQVKFAADLIQSRKTMAVRDME